MSAVHYDRLSELDRSFLIYEGPNSPMHVGVVQIFEAASLRGADGHIDIERITEYVESRLHRIPRYRQKVVEAPLDRHPIWVDDPKLNLRYHVRHSRLPRPADERTLKRTCARILEQRLDLHKPLWELWVVEGLADDRLALISKTHHCMIDGVSGVDLMSVLLTPEPCEKADPPPLWRPRRGPSAAEYAAGETARRLERVAELGRSVRDVLADEGGARERLRERVEATGRLLRSGARGAPPAPFNQPIGPHRRFDWLPMSLDEIGALRSALGGTLNDVVLAVAAGALRRFLKISRHTDPDALELRAMAPVSMRALGEHGQLGNRVSAWLVPLPIGERDPLRRYAKVRETTAELKAHHEALGTETLSQAIEWLGSTPITLGARLMRDTSPFNLVITNVPGPRTPLFLLGSRMLAAHPWVPLMGVLGIGIALFSYERTLSWGFSADWDLVPDLHDLVLEVEREFQQLRRAAGGAEG
jgi:diacylglycerol O-acyltransferase / wax synthase